MGFYQQRILPKIISCGMNNKAMAKYRPRIPPLASRRVLEVGLGSGLNIPYYTTAVEHLFGLEPSRQLLGEAEALAAEAPFPVDLIAGSAEDIPLETASIDMVVSTWTLCSIPKIELAMQEMRRVLKPGGRLLFLEHGRAPDAGVARWQDRITPVFRVLAGCNINRPIDQLINDAGFDFVDIQRDYMDGPRFIAYHFIGQAQPR